MKRSTEESKLLEEEVIQEYRKEFYGNTVTANSEDGNETLTTDNSLKEGSVVAAGLKSF